MKVRQKLCIYPHQCLRQPMKPVTEFDDLLKRKIERMTNIMREFNGQGIAANQIFLDDALFLAYIEDKIKVFCNPRLVEHSEEHEFVINREGCLSVPGVESGIDRFTYVVLEYQDENGEEQTIRAEKDAAMVLQHEMDHLNGHLFIDNLSRLKLDMIERRMLKLKKKNGLI